MEGMRGGIKWGECVSKVNIYTRGVKAGWFGDGSEQKKIYLWGVTKIIRKKIFNSKRKISPSSVQFKHSQ